MSLPMSGDLGIAVHEFATKFMSEALTRNKGCVSKTASELHMHRNTVSRWKKKIQENRTATVLKKRVRRDNADALIKLSERMASLNQLRRAQ